MSDQTLPEKLKRFYNVHTVDEMWSKLLTEGNVRIRRSRPIYSRLPSNPRCANCHRPFAGIGGTLLRVVQGVRRSDKNPRYCAGRHSFTSQFPGGAEIELTMLLVDVRGSTTIAERMDASEFSRLMNRFYESALNVLGQGMENEMTNSRYEPGKEKKLTLAANIRCSIKHAAMARLMKLELPDGSQ